MTVDHWRRLRCWGVWMGDVHVVALPEWGERIAVGPSADDIFIQAPLSGHPPRTTP
jgi:hypothetical protein